MALPSAASICATTVARGAMATIMSVALACKKRSESIQIPAWPGQYTRSPRRSVASSPSKATASADILGLEVAVARRRLAATGQGELDQRRAVQTDAAAPRNFSTTSTRSGAKIVFHGRYVTFKPSEMAVRKELFRKILRSIDDVRRKPAMACEGKISGHEKEKEGSSSGWREN